MEVGRSCTAFSGRYNVTWRTRQGNATRALGGIEKPAVWGDRTPEGTCFAVVSTANGMLVAKASATSVCPSQAAQCTGMNLFESSATMLYGSAFILQREGEEAIKPVQRREEKRGKKKTDRVGSFISQQIYTIVECSLQRYIPIVQCAQCTKCRQCSL